MTLTETEIGYEALDYVVENPVLPDPDERRSRVRFPIRLPLVYRTLDRTFRSGRGRTLNISSAGLLVEARCDHLALGTTVEISIAWPARTQGQKPLFLVMSEFPESRGRSYSYRYQA
jgi:hypothetical protein